MSVRPPARRCSPLGVLPPWRPSRARPPAWRRACWRPRFPWPRPSAVAVAPLRALRPLRAAPAPSCLRAWPAVGGLRWRARPARVGAAGVRRAAARRAVNSHVTNHDHNHNQPWPSGPSGCGPSAGAARACSLRLASAAAPPLPPARLRALRPAPPVSVRFARAGLKPPLYRARVGVFGLAVGRFASGARAAFAAGALCGGCVLCGSSGGLFRLLVPRRSCASAEAALVRPGALRAPRGSRCADVAGAAPLRSARPLVGRTGDQRLRRAVKGKSSVPSAGTQNKPSAVRAPCRLGGCVAPPPGPPASADTRSWSAWP